MGVPLRVNLPDVGTNLSVHIGAGLSYSVNATDTFDDIFRNSTIREMLLDEWKRTNGGGPLGGGFGNKHIFFRLPSNSTIFQTHPDPAPGTDSPHFQSGVQVSKQLCPPSSSKFPRLKEWTFQSPTSRALC
jgi:hypothetical protein